MLFDDSPEALRLSSFASCLCRSTVFSLTPSASVGQSAILNGGIFFLLTRPAVVKLATVWFAVPFCTAPPLWLHRAIARRRTRSVTVVFLSHGSERPTSATDLFITICWNGSEIIHARCYQTGMARFNAAITASDLDGLFGIRNESQAGVVAGQSTCCGRSGLSRPVTVCVLDVCLTATSGNLIFL